MDTSQREEKYKKRVLFVGEGDFSFAATYITKSRDYAEKIYATCLNNSSLTEMQQKNIEIIKQNGGFTFTDVDATCLESHSEIKKLQFCKIIFNFPHIPGKMNIRKNRQLVEQFFMSARKILADSGTVCVTLCQGQGGTDIEKIKRKWCDTWQIVRLAASASFILYQIKIFEAEAFETYRCTGFRGLEKSFNTKGALTHIFKDGPPVLISYDFEKKYLDIDLYQQSCKTLHRNFYRNVCQPSFKVLSILNDISLKIFPSIHQENINDLLTCQKTFSSHSHSSCNVTMDICEECAKNLFTQFYNYRNAGCITSIACTISCMKNIDINKNPIYHFLSYFSADFEQLLRNIPLFLEKIKEIYSLRSTVNVLNIPDDSLNFKRFLQTLRHNSDFTDCKKLTIKNILNLYAVYSLNQGDELFFYSDVNFVAVDNGLEVENDNNVKVGSVLQFEYNFKRYICILFNLNPLAFLKYHIMDYRMLLSENSFYFTNIFLGCPADVYRNLSLYPPIYVHDISFYISSDFSENDFFLVVRNIVGYLIKSITLVDSYYDKKLSKYSRCYRFIYQSCNQALTKDIANEIHSCFLRKALRNSLNILLR